MIKVSFPPHCYRYALVLTLATVVMASVTGCNAARKGVGGPQGEMVQAEVAELGVADFRQTVREARDRVFPAVVFIKCVSENMESGRRVSIEANGSGVLISPTGEIVTNWHVVDKAVEIRCLLLDGSAYTATVIGTDKDTDLALLKLNLPEGAPPLPYATFGDSGGLSEGDFVMAMGAPWGLSRSVSIGIISSTARYLPNQSEYSLWLQTDASISPGNSGGPLVDTEGRIIGINTRGIMMGGDVGFAIPSATVQMLLPQLREGGQVDWSWTGLQLQALRDFNRNIYFDGQDGVIVAGTEPESPARIAGILARDRILSIDDVPITALTDESLPAARRMLGMLALNQEVEVKLLRGSEPMTLRMTPREKGKVEGQELDCPRWDLTVKVINQFDNPELFFFDPEGVFIFGVRHPGNAARSGLREKDVILEIDGQPIRTLEDVQAAYDKAMENLRQRSRVNVTIRRNGQWMMQVLEFSRDHRRE